MAYTFHELRGKTIDELREIAKGVENQDAAQGYSQLNKEHLIPALCKAPFYLAGDVVHVVAAKRREKVLMGAISQGQGFDYGASTSIREDAQGFDRQHHFLQRDEIMFVLMSQAILVREVRAFLRKHDVSLTGFDHQVDEISKSTYKYYNVHVGDVSDSVVAIGAKPTATMRKKSKDED